MTESIADPLPTRESTSCAPLLSLRNVGKAFPSGTIALEGLDLDVRKGEFLTLLGPSGCGKSTALRIIAGLAEPSSGQIEWAAAGPGRAEIGFVFQEPTLAPWSSLFDNVWLPLRLRGLSRRAARAQIEKAMALVGLAEFADARPFELSGGMKMRASIARALVLRPRLLLMDEPFAALDEITRFKLNNDLLELKAELDATIVFVTHSVFESVYLSSRIGVFGMRPGRIVETIAIKEPLTRQADFRHSPYYSECCRVASQALERAMTIRGEK